MPPVFVKGKKRSLPFGSHNGSSEAVAHIMCTCMQSATKCIQTLSNCDYRNPKIISSETVHQKSASKIHDDCESAGDEEAEQLEFRIIDYGHARLAKNKALAKLPKAPGLELSYRK